MYWLYRLAGFIIPLLPPWFAYRLADIAGSLMYWLAAGSRRNVLANLRHVLGPHASEAEVAATARRVFRNQMRNYFDLFRLARLHADQIEALVNLDILQVIEAGLAAGRGLVAISPHFGNLDIVMQILALRGYTAWLVVERLQPERLHRYVSRLRASNGLHLVEIDRAPMKIFRALRRNEIVLLACDRDVTNNGIEISFFGTPTRLPDGYARLIRRTGARWGVAFSHRRPDNTFWVRGFLGPEMPVTADQEADERAIVEYVVREMEAEIRAYPDQWVMFQRIWPEAEIGDGES